MYPPLDTNFVCLSFSECYPPGLIWLFGRFDFFFFLRLRFDVFLCSIQGHSQLVKWFLKFAVTIKVFTYHVRVHLTSRREDKRLGPGLVPVVRTLDGALQALRGASPAPPPQRACRTGYYTAYKC